MQEYKYKDAGTSIIMGLGNVFITSLKNRLNYFIKPPDWKHDGSSILSSDLRKSWEE